MVWSAAIRSPPTMEPAPCPRSWRAVRSAGSSAAPDSWCCKDITAGPSSTAPIGSSVGIVVLESGTQTTMLQGGSVYQFRGFPYLDFTGQDARFKTVIAAL